jgi:dTDP-4-amino-4,6-dideoxygalactose transaminase
MIEDLAKSGISSIVPINDWELLDKSVKYPNALALSSETVSLPIYPTLSMDVVASIGSLLSV